MSPYTLGSAITDDITLYAKWLPRTNTAYKVEHYTQDVTGTGYTLKDTDNLTGTTDATVTAGTKTYTGFAEHTTHADRVPSGSVAPDGTLVLKLYYNRNLHSVEFDSKGGSSVTTQTGIRFEGTATEPTSPTKTGYDFGGWWADEECTIAYDLATTVTDNITIYASWTPRSDTAYKVEHYLQDVAGAGYTLKGTDNLTGTTDTSVTASAKTYTGFTEHTTHADRVPSGSVSPGGSTVLKLYYNRNLHSVAYDTKGGSSVTTQTGIRFENTATKPADPSKRGYDFGGWWDDEDCTIAYDFATPVTDNITIYASWTPRSDTAYKVEHYLQDVAGAGYTLKGTDNLTGITDTTVTASAKTYTGFTEHTTHADRVPSGSVSPSGSTVLKLYYNRNLHSVAYDTKGGSSVTTQTGIRFEDAATEPAAPTKQGYNFAGWHLGASPYDFTTPVTSNLTLTATWSPRSDIAYKVQHYQQDVTEGGYTLKDTDTLTGITDATVTASAKTYTGFTELTTHVDRVPSGSVAPNGSLVLKLYYDRNLHSVAYNTKGGSSVATQAGIRFEGTATEPTVPTKTGYDFGSWWADEDCTIAYDFATPVTEDITVYASWTPRNDTVYKVEHYQQSITGSGYSLKDTDNLTGTTDTTVTASAKTYTGFAENATHADRVPSGSVAPAGTTMLKLYYNRNLHSVEYNTKGGSSVAKQDGIRFGATATEPTVPTKTGYDFGGWWADEACTIAFDFATPITTDVTVYAAWSPRSDTAYTVEHYQQAVTGGGYTLKDTETLTGTTGATVTASAKTYTGFAEHITHTDRTPSGSVAPAGTTVLKLYYNRNLHSVEYNTKGGASVATQSGIRFGATATEPTPPSKTGYDFGGWWADEVCTVAFDFATPITTDVTVYASWAPRSDTAYRAEHYQQNVTEAGYTLRDTDELTGTTDATVTASTKSYTGFAEHTTHADRIPSGSVAPDGSLVLKLYYDRDTHSVEYNTKGGSPVAKQDGIRFGATATKPANPTKTGYDFGGWWVDEDCTIAVDFATPITADVTAYAAWSPRSDTAYTVEHYQQAVAGAGYTLKDTDQLTGTTGATVTASPKTYTGFQELTTHADRVPSGSVVPAGTTVLKLYYNRNLHSVEYNTKGGTSVAKQNGIRFGATATEPSAPTKTGYDFAGWWADEDCTIAFDFATPITADVTAYVAWSPRSDTAYTVQHYQQAVAGAGYTLKDTDQLTGTTDTTVTASAKTYTGFTEHTTHADRIPSSSVAPDGSTILKRYYNRTAYTITFSPNGGTIDVPSAQVKYGCTYGEMPTPAWENHTFIGWYTRADGGSKISASDAMEKAEDSTLYALWANDDFGVVDGDVSDQDGNPVANAKITIRAGAVDYKTTHTDERGHFTVTAVKYATYNLVVEKDARVVTSLFEMKSAQVTQRVVLPNGTTNSVIVVEDNTPEIVVGGLDNLFGREEVYTKPDTAVVDSGGKVELRLNIAEKKSEAAGEEGKELTQGASKPLNMLLEMNITKEVYAAGADTPTTVEALTELPELMTIIIPLTEEQQGREGYMVYRAHSGNVDEISEEPNEGGEYIVVGSTQLVLYACKFSLYAVAFDVPTAGGSSYTITAVAGNGGTISPTGKVSVIGGLSKTFTITPDAGHRIADVLVDGKSVGAVDTYKFSRVSAKHSIEAVFYCPFVKYSDLDAAKWYHADVDYVLNAGYMQGIGRGRFAPERAVTRAEFVAILARLQETAPSLGVTGYEDVPATAWYATAVAWAQENGVGVGYSKRHFAPGDVLTREQLALMLYRYAGSVKSGSAEQMGAYIDGGRASRWAADAMVWAVNAGILQGNGKGYLSPTGEITRAEVAAILRRYTAI